MYRRFAGLLVIILLAVSLGACNLTTSAPQVTNQQTEVAQQVEATMVALQATMQAGVQASPIPGAGVQQPQPQATAVPPTGQSSEPTGSITGELTFPNGSIPQLRIVAFEVAEGRPTGQYYYIETNPGQTAYEMTQLPATSYFLIAYTLPSYSGQPMAAGYTQAVVCGLSASCTDHNLVGVQVNAGQVTQGVNPTDWNAPPEVYPNDPVG